MMVGVLLAGGASTRMGSPKPLRKARGRSFLAHGIQRLWSTCTTVVVVLGAKAAQVRGEVEEEFDRIVRDGVLGELPIALGHGVDRLEVRFVVNPRWRQGMYSSVRLGLKKALDQRPHAIVLLPVDHPTLRAGTVIDLAKLMGAALGACRSPQERKRFSYALVPRYRRLRGHPVALSAALSQAIAKDGKAANLSDAVRRNARMLGFLDVEDPGVITNQNTP
jgi:CTP:molybdopterin cytidylyltransferase MocA